MRFIQLLCAAVCVQSAFGAYQTTYKGCFQDNGSKRTISNYPLFEGDKMTVEKCVSLCGDAGYNTAGLQYGVQCFCGNGNGYAKGALDATGNSCSSRCAGDTTEACGGYYYNSVYTLSATGYVGCFRDGGSNGGDSHQRDISAIQRVYDPTMTIENCVSFCQREGFLYAGLQYGNQCYCGNSYGSYGALAAGACSMACAADSSETCGGNWANQVYSTNILSVTPGPVKVSLSDCSPSDRSLHTICIAVINTDAGSSLRTLIVRVTSSSPISGVTGLTNQIVEQNTIGNYVSTFNVVLNGGVPRGSTVQTSSVSFASNVLSTFSVEPLTYGY